MRYPITALLAVALLTGCSEGEKFQSCAEAEQAGVMLPLTVGDTGWNSDLDRDGDGRACE